MKLNAKLLLFLFLGLLARRVESAEVSRSTPASNAAMVLPDVPPRPAVADAMTLALPGTVQLQGWLGDKLGLCLDHRVWGLDPEPLVDVLRNHNDTNNWRGEYWGKWYTAAVLAYAYEPTAAHRAQLEKVAREVIDIQQPDGYLGPYQKNDHLKVWDIWCRKYVLLGLIAAYDLTGDKTALAAAGRDADNLINDLDHKKVKLVELGVPELKGLANSSIIEPVALLYQRTGNPKYLAFAQSIIAQWNAPYGTAPQGIHMLEKALADAPPLQNHAYTIMSCFEGICELYRATGDRQYLDGAVRFGQSVRRYERMIDGSTGNHELFCDGVRYQTEFLEKPQETCATVTWIKLCAQLLRLTGDPVWADEMELSLYNAMIGAMTPGGEWCGYFTELTGERVPSFNAHPDLNLSCCMASAPRGLLLTPRWAVMTAPDGPVVNLYAPGTASVKLPDGAEVKIVQETDYPVGDQIKLTISPAHKQRFTLSLRIPAWSQRTALAVNGETVACAPGKYAKLDREWTPGDQVLLTLDLRGRVLPAPSGAPQLALMRGPILLALDNRLVPSTPTAVWLNTNTDGFVELKPLAAKPAWAWMAFEVPFQVHPSHFYGRYTTNLAMCDFSSAGNAWNEKNLYRTWLPQPLYLGNAYASNTWILQNPYQPDPRPAIPTGVQAKDAAAKP